MVKKILSKNVNNFNVKKYIFLGLAIVVLIGAIFGVWKIMEKRGVMAGKAIDYGSGSYDIGPDDDYDGDGVPNKDDAFPGNPDKSEPDPEPTGSSPGPGSTNILD